MPAKKVVETAEETAATKKTTKKPAATKAAAKTATKKTTTTKKTTAAKKTTTKKTTTAKKAAEPKKAEVKVEEKKPEVKVEEKKPEVVKKTVKNYEDIINWKKGEAHAMDWLYIEINAGDLLTEVEAGVDNLATACQAILNCMLEGDGFIVEPAEENKVNSSLTVRYYCDNLSQDRRKYFN